MSRLIEIAGVRRTIEIAATIYGFTAGVAGWLLDFSDADNSAYLALF